MKKQFLKNYLVLMIALVGLGLSSQVAKAAAPTVTPENISVSGATGDGGEFIIYKDLYDDEVVVVEWDNSVSGGDNNLSITGVTVNFSQFEGDANVQAFDDGGTNENGCDEVADDDIWTACHTMEEGTINGVGVKYVSVTATDGTDSTTTMDDTGYVVDNVAPADDSTVDTHNADATNFSFNGITTALRKVFYEIFDDNGLVASDYAGQAADGSGNYVFSGINISSAIDGVLSLYVWVQDAAGNFSPSFNDSVDFNKTGNVIIREITAAIDAEYSNGSTRTLYILTQADYTPESWSEYVAAIVSAIAVEANAGATLSEDANAIEAIEDSRDSLELTAAGALAIAIDEANEQLANAAGAQASYIGAGGNSTDTVYVDVTTAQADLNLALNAEPQVTIDIESATVALVETVDLLEDATDELIAITIDATFDGIAAALRGNGIANNLDDVTIDNIDDFSGLYFEKSVAGAKMGRITFNESLDLSNSETQLFLQSLESKMDMAEVGVIALNFSETTDVSLDGVGATIKFYNLERLGLDTGLSDSALTDLINEKLIARDDNGDILDKTSLVLNDGVYLGACEVDGTCRSFIVDVEHFTQYEIDNTVPVLSGTPAPSGTLNHSNGNLNISFTDDNGFNPTDKLANIVSYKIDNVETSGAENCVTISADHLTFTYACTIGGLPDGIHTIDFQVKDLAGNESLNTSWTYTIDTTAPTIAIVNPNTGSAPSKTVTASASDGTLTMAINASGVTTCEETLTFGAYADTTFSAEADNGKSICYRAEDAVGNVEYGLSGVISGITIPLDSDGDGVPDADDNCQSTSNADQLDADGDGIGDLCDNCVNVVNVDQADIDGDGVGNVCDVPSDDATVTSGTYSVGVDTITNVPFGTANLTFLAALTRATGATWNDSGVHNPVVTGDTLVVKAEDEVTIITYTITTNAELSHDATVTSGNYTVSSVGGGSETITGVPFGTAKTTFLAAMTKGQEYQNWDNSDIANPVVTGDTLVVTAEDGTTVITYTITTDIDPNIALVAADKAALVDGSIQGANPDLISITTALTNPLPAAGSNASVITWVSSAPSVVSNNGQTINRPTFSSGDATVTMTATITKGVVTDTRTFTLTVIKSLASSETTLTSDIYSVGADTITDVPFGTTKADFLDALEKGQANQAWNSDSVSGIVMSGNVLVVTAEDGTTTRTYTITIVPSETSDIGDKMEEAFLNGDISIEGGNPTETEKITFEKDLILEDDNVSVSFPAGTEITKTNGGNMDLSDMTVEDIVLSLNAALTQDVAGAIKIGFPDMKLTFSKPITVTIIVGASYNGQTLNVYYQSEGEATWTKETSCTVSDGKCVFQTTHATKFASSSDDPAGDGGDSNNSSKDSCGKNCKLYKQYKKDFKTAANKKTHAQLKNLKKTRLAEFNRLKAVYAKYKGSGNRVVAKLDAKTQADYKLYKKYRGYKLYLTYKDKTGN